MSVVSDDGYYPAPRPRPIYECWNCQARSAWAHDCSVCGARLTKKCPLCDASYPWMGPGHDALSLHRRSCPKRPLHQVLRNIFRYWRRPPAGYIRVEERRRLWAILTLRGLAERPRSR